MVSIWNTVIERFKKRLAGWETNFLSLEARAVLDRYVLFSLPMYVMSLFQMQVTVRGKLGAIQRRFFWGGDGTKRKSIG